MVDLRAANFSSLGVVVLVLISQLLVLSETASVVQRPLNERCSKCPPGFGVVRPCSPEADTECGECAKGTYNSHHSATEGCFICSRCGPSLYEAHPCTGRTDTVCDRCATIKGPHNRDFFSKHCNDTIFIVEQPPPSSARRDDLYVQYQHDPVADHQQLKASPPERPQWAMVGAVSASVFALAALLATITLRVHSFYARKLQEDDSNLDQEMTLLKEIRPPDDLDDIICLGHQEMTLILHEDDAHEESEAIG